MARALSLLLLAPAFLLVPGRLAAQADAVVAVADARLGSNVENRMIVQEATSFPVDSKVFLWIKVVGAPPGGVTVTWKTGEYSHATTLSVGGSPWRTWATKTVRQAGNWTVTVTDENGTVLKELPFTVE